jgi:hypothetical protein
MSISQKEMFETYFPHIVDQGNEFYKCSLVLVRRAKDGEYIETWTADGLETTNYAKPGDFVVKNLQTEYMEEYIVTEKVFFQRYKFFYFSDSDHAVYMPTGKIKAVMYVGEDTSFIAAWGRQMMLKTGDFLVSPYPYLNEVYRIASKEFYESYEKLDC